MDPVPDLIKAIFERGNAMQSFWSFYISVSLAYVAFFGSAQRTRKIAVMMTIAFLGFACVNGGGIVQRARERHELYQLATKEGALPGKWDALLTVSEPDPPAKVLKFHVAVDISVLLAIWVLTLMPRESTRKQ